MTIVIQEQIYAIWLPLVITVIFCGLGLLLGAVRGAIVAASLVLGIAINDQWAARWSEELHELNSAFDQHQMQFLLSIIVLWLILLVIGYGLGTLVPRHVLSSQSRLLGGLVGLATGAAAAGWSLRYSIINPDGTLSQSSLLDNNVAWGFMLWAGWFGLALAIGAAAFVLIGPLRRAQTAVARPSAATDWTPETAPTASLMSPSQQYPSGYSMPGTTAPSAFSPAPSAAPAYIQNADNSQTVAFREHQDAPPTQYLPVSQKVDTSDEGVPDSDSGSDQASALASAADPTASAKPDASDPSSSWLHWTGNDAAKASVEGESQKRCSNCGAPITAGASFCTECGTKVA